MRQEASERISDIVYAEAINDDAVEMVIQLQVQARSQAEDLHPIEVGPSLAYMLLDALQLGVNVPEGTAQVVDLRVELPAGWSRDMFRDVHERERAMRPTLAEAVADGEENGREYAGE